MGVATRSFSNALAISNNRSAPSANTVPVKTTIAEATARSGDSKSEVPPYLLRSSAGETRPPH